MIFTVIDDATNQILRYPKLDNRIIDTAVKEDDDPESKISDFLESELAIGESAYEGYYAETHFTFNGTDFIRKEDVYTPLIQRIVDELITTTLRQLEDAGHSLELHQEPIMNRAQAKSALDLAASRAIVRIVSKGAHLSDEHSIVSAQVKQWRAAGSPTNNLPRAIDDDWVTERGITSEAAAQEVEQAEQVHTKAILDLRNLRHLAAAKIKNDTTGNFVNIARTYIGLMNSYEPD